MTSFIFTKGIGFLMAGAAITLYCRGEILKALFFIVLGIFWVVVTR